MMTGQKLYWNKVRATMAQENVDQKTAMQMIREQKNNESLNGGVLAAKRKKHMQAAIGVIKPQNGQVNDKVSLVKPSQVELPEDVLSLSQIKIATLEHEIDEQDKLIADKRRMLEAWQKIQSALQNA